MVVPERKAVIPILHLRQIRHAVFGKRCRHFRFRKTETSAIPHGRRRDHVRIVEVRKHRFFAHPRNSGQQPAFQIRIVFEREIQHRSHQIRHFRPVAAQPRFLHRRVVFVYQNDGADAFRLKDGGTQTPQTVLDIGVGCSRTELRKILPLLRCQFGSRPQPHEVSEQFLQFRHNQSAGGRIGTALYAAESHLDYRNRTGNTTHIGILPNVQSVKEFRLILVRRRKEPLDRVDHHRLTETPGTRH